MKNLLIGIFALVSVSAYAEEYKCVGNMKVTAISGESDFIKDAIIYYKDSALGTLEIHQNELNTRSVLTKINESNVFDVNFRVDETQELKGTASIESIDQGLLSLILKTKAFVNQLEVGSLVGVYSCTRQ